MSWVVGIDGCRGGWIAAGQRERGGEVRFVRLRRLNDLEATFPDFRLAAIDMPIGLSESDRRAADVESRKFISPRGSSVFPSLIRPVLACSSYERGKDLSLALTGRAFSKQAWMLKERTIEVDALIDDLNVREKVWEVHPEVSFRLMAGRGLTLSKHCDEGIEFRKILLSSAFPSGWEHGRSQFKKSEADDHDLLDSLAALWSAWRILEGDAEYFPPKPFQRDSQGRRMVIAG